MKQRIGPQTFIVKMLIVSYTEECGIYIKRKEGARRLAARDTERERERECVCVCTCVHVRDRESLKMEVALVVKMAVGRTDRFGIS
jgi:hypothetical protein